VFVRPKCLRSPMKPLVPCAENASEYPQRYHWKVMTEKVAMVIHSIVRADFRRARPEYKNPRPGIMTTTMAEATMM